MAELFLGGIVDAATHERTAHDETGYVRLPTEDFTTHGVIVGMTGSGKTGLGVVLVEEALRAGRPVLAIDPKGDLTNLCLTFPELQPADFRPWIDEAQAAAAGRSPDEFAAGQAERWRTGLADWGLDGAAIAALRAAADVTIYTPGSQSGVPLNIVGSLQRPDTDDAEVIGDEIESYVSGLLGLVGIDADPLSSREHILLSNLVAHAWSAPPQPTGLPLDLTALVGMVATPPIRKLGVFELDQFFPEDERMELALRLNGLLASPSFAAWAQGPPLDVASMLVDADGRPRCAIVTTAHLSDDERQFVTALVLSKLVTWTRRQSGTTDLRALLYMDEVAGYLPPSAKPPTKQPIMLLLKQARAFGVGVVLSTQNPMDVDYKALSNAGTWMVGRLQTDRDKARLVDGMRTVAGDVDVATLDDTISGLGKREFLLRRAGASTPEVFTTRWAMSYLRGPLTRDQIATLMAGREVVAPPSTATDAVDTAGAAPAAAAPASTLVGADESVVMPEVAPDVPVRYVDPAAPWLGGVGGTPTGSRLAAAAVARVAVRYDEAKADLVHDEEFEAVLFPLDEHLDASEVIHVDHDDRDLRADPPAGVTFRLPEAKIQNKGYWQTLERELRDHLVGSLRLSVPANGELKLYGRPGESDDEFAERARAAARRAADEEIAALRDEYESKAKTLRDRIEAAEDRVDVLAEQASSRQTSDMLSTAGSLLGGLLGGRRSAGALLGDLGTATRRRGSSRAAAERVEAAENKVARLVDDLEELEAELADDLREIEDRWTAATAATETIEVGVEKSDVTVRQLVLAWLPVA